MVGRQPHDPREPARRGGSLRARERSSGASLREVERPVARPPFPRTGASGGSQECRGTVPPSCGARRADTDFETVFVDASGHLRGVRAQHLPLRSGDAVVGVLILAFDTRRPPSAPTGLEPQPRLTPRQHEILGLIASGLSTSEIATQLTISPETVRNHIRSLFSELNVHTRLEAMAAGQRLGLLAPQALGPQPPDPRAHTG